MDNYSSLIFFFPVMEKAASDFNPCRKETDNALRNSTIIMPMLISHRITFIPFKLCKLLNKYKLEFN